MEIAIAMCHHDRAEDMKLGTKDLIMTLLRSLQKAGQVDNIKKFINSLGSKMNLLFRGHIWIKTSIIKCDPEAYVELLYTEQERPKEWMVNTEVLTEALANNPELWVKLEHLADQGFVPAASLAAKMAIVHRDFEKFERYLPLVPEILLKSKRAGIFDHIDTVEKMTNVIEALKRQKMSMTVIENVANNCMAIKKDKSHMVEAAHEAVSAGVKLEAFAKSTLVRLKDSEEFRHREAAKKMVEGWFVYED